VLYLEERRLYHRKDGGIIKLRDDVLCAGRYGLMMRRFFKPLDECGFDIVPGVWPSRGSPRRGGSSGPQMARDVDFDLS
jgi:hypothetical protein